MLIIIIVVIYYVYYCNYYDIIIITSLYNFLISVFYVNIMFMKIIKITP